jgi:hypothetical protein
MTLQMPRDGQRTQPVVIPAFCRIRDVVDFYAVTADISMQGVRLRSARIPRLGEVLECRIRNVEPFEGRVVDVSTMDFTVRVGGPAPGTIARQLLQAARLQAASDAPVRTHRRIVPDASEVVVILPDARTIDARILNVSASGVAIGTTEPVAVDALIVVGSTHAQVMRVFDDGFGAAFLRPFDPGAIDGDLIL